MSKPEPVEGSEQRAVVQAEAVGRRPAAAGKDDRLVVVDKLEAQQASFLGYFASTPSRPRSSGRRLQVLLFLLIVVLPTLAASVYYGLVASNQYVTDIQFGVRSPDAQRNDVSSIFSGSGGAASQIASQSNMVVQYIKSREIVDAINRRFDLRQAYSRAGIDYLSRLDSDVPVETLVDYWRGKVDPFFDLTTGIITVRVRAFSPQDALRIGNEILELSEKLVDELSKRARDDFVKFARDQVGEAAESLAKAREALLTFRNQSQSIDPTKEADQARLGLSKLREELAKVETDLATVRGRMGSNAPPVVSLRDRQAALKQQIEGAEKALASVEPRQPKVASRDIRTYDTLETDRQLAEKYYESAQQTLQRAQFEASRRAMYLEVFVRPSLAEKSVYPRRVTATMIVALSALGVWIFLLMIYHSVREHV